MHRHLPNYLRTHRKRWALTQDELALLLGLTSQVAISQYEADEKRPGSDILLGAEVIFGAPPRDLFPKVYGEIEDAVIRRAKELYERLELRTDLPAATKLRLLTDMMRRIEGDAANV